MPETSSIASYWVWAGTALALLCLLLASYFGKRRRLVEDLPTSKTTGVFIGLVELKGTAEAEQSLTSYLAGAKCVLYSWSVAEQWSRTVTETYTDSEGKQQTRTRYESGSTTVAEGDEAIPFYLKDDCGVIRIVPDGAKIEPQIIFSQTCDRSDPLYYGKGPEHAVPDSDHRRCFTETAIPLHAQLYVMGQARERNDVVAAEIAHNPSAPMFLISTRTEKEVRSGLQWGFRILTVLGMIFFVGGFIARDMERHIDPAAKWAAYFFPALGYLGIAIVGWVWMVYNSLVNLRQRVRQGWSQVDVQLKRRSDLIPNLVQTVKGLRDYERALQTELAELRSQLEATPPGVEGPDHRAVSKTLIAVAEKYPELKAQESFLNLHKHLVETEERIALARGYFNEIATFYNTRLQVVPERFVAMLAGLKPQALMMAEGFERPPVTVNLAD